MDAAWPLQGGKSVQIPSPSKALERGMEGSRVRYLPIDSPMRTCRSDAPILCAQTKSPQPQTKPRLAIRVTNTHPNYPRPRIQPLSEWHLPGRRPIGLSGHIGSVFPDSLKQIPVSVTDIKFPGKLSLLTRSRYHSDTKSSCRTNDGAGDGL